MNKEDLSNFDANLVFQMGWLVGEDNKVYKVSGQLCDSGDVGDTIAILKSTVKKFKRLKINRIGE